MLRILAVNQKFLVFLVFTLGIGAFFIFERPYDQCDAVAEGSRMALVGVLFPRTTKDGVSVAPTLPKAVRDCKILNSAGGCVDFFSQARSVVREFEVSVGCESRLGEVSEFRGVLEQVLVLLSQIAWGDGPPPEGERGLGWLETSELSLFCQARQAYLNAFGETVLQETMRKIFSSLPGEKPVFEDKKCVNCETRKSASAVLGDEGVWVRSLFSLRCENYY